MHLYSNVQVISTLGDISMQTLSPHVFFLFFLLHRRKGGKAMEDWGVTGVKGEVEAKAAAKRTEQEGRSLRADCSPCPPAVHPDGRRPVLTEFCAPDRGSEQDGTWGSARGILVSFVHLFFHIKPNEKKLHNNFFIQCVSQQPKWQNQIRNCFYNSQFCTQLKNGDNR